MRALHPDAQSMLALIREAERPTFEQLSPETARLAYAASRAALQKSPPHTAETLDWSVPGPGGAVRLRMHRATGSSPSAPLPCLLYLHGGEWVLGDVDSHDGICRELANATGCSVIAADYRLTPEHRFPAALEDCAATLSWIAGHAADLRIDPARIAVGGDSPGGNLAAVLALMGRDGIVPAAVFQLLPYPAVDLAMTSDSYGLVTGDAPLTAATMRYFTDRYLPEPSALTEWRASPPLQAPRRRSSLRSGTTCSVTRAALMQREGVAVTALHVNDRMHGLLTMSGVIGAAKPLLHFAGAALREAWRPEPG